MKRVEVRMKRKAKLSTTAEDAAEREKSLETLASAFAEDLYARQQMPLEPFEAYLQKVKFSLYSDVELFRMRFARGYRAILEELESKQ